MKLAVIGICFVTSCIVAGEPQFYEGSISNGKPSAPPAYFTQQPTRNETTPAQGYRENSNNCVMCDCRGAQFCCAGDSSGNDFCIIACCSTLVKGLSGADFFAEPDNKVALD